MDTQTLDVRQWDPRAGEWVTVRVEAEPVKRTRTRRRPRKRAGRPLDLTGLSDGSPIPSWWRDTAFADMGPLADMRTYVKPATMATHRPAVVMPADPGSITVTR